MTGAGWPGTIWNGAAVGAGAPGSPGNSMPVDDWSKSQVGGAAEVGGLAGACALEAGGVLRGAAGAEGEGMAGAWA
jgi:hypothetical protein